jgi:hypothetical protein
MHNDSDLSILKLCPMSFPKQWTMPLFINTTLSITYKVATSLERQNRNSTPAKRMAVTTRRKMQLSSAAQ